MEFFVHELDFQFSERFVSKSERISAANNYLMRKYFL